jgi:hypothetical protein
MRSHSAPCLCQGRGWQESAASRTPLRKRRAEGAPASAGCSRCGSRGELYNTTRYITTYTTYKSWPLQRAATANRDSLRRNWSRTIGVHQPRPNQPPPPLLLRYSTTSRPTPTLKPPNARPEHLPPAHPRQQHQCHATTQRRSRGRPCCYLYALPAPPTSLMMLQARALQGPAARRQRLATPAAQLMDKRTRTMHTRTSLERAPCTAAMQSRRSPSTAQGAERLRQPISQGRAASTSQPSLSRPAGTHGAAPAPGAQAPPAASPAASPAVQLPQQLPQRQQPLTPPWCASGTGTPPPATPASRRSSRARWRTR